MYVLYVYAAVIVGAVSLESMRREYECYRAVDCQSTEEMMKLKGFE